MQLALKSVLGDRRNMLHAERRNELPPIRIASVGTHAGDAGDDGVREFHGDSENAHSAQVDHVACETGKNEEH